MNPTKRHPLPRLGRVACALSLGAPLLAQGAVPALGTADLSIHADGSTVTVELSAAAQTLVGFSGAPTDAASREVLKVAEENLKHGEALVRFNPLASCVLDDAKVDADPREHEGEAGMGASYRFNCQFPKSFSSAALGIFSGFNALQRVHVRYTTADGQGAAILTRENPVVNFVPLK
ncbi:DUF2796 domain-containing protein [uncultured Thiodictyon sp.]|uniref:ZrgA family zinc uptake protein n=1 Tax=uncultured Thiodictyon sp. TaxID=1846217 RepID=UPI002600F6EA|nr:DUF2796 domain-containing protein [uncultured Thiodictyon sp.]